MWLGVEGERDTAFARVFGLRANLFAAYGDFYARLWDPAVLDPRVVELCRLRVAQLLGCASEQAGRSRPAVEAGLTESTVAQLRWWPTADAFDETARACLAFTEQFVLDPRLISPADRARVRDAVGYRRLVGLTQAVAVFDGFDRFRLVLGLDGPGGTDHPSGTGGPSGTDNDGHPPAPAVVEVGTPDPSVPKIDTAGTGPDDDPARGFSAAQPDLFASFERLYGVLWSGGVVDHPSKEVARLRNARVTGCKFCRNVRFARARRDGLTEDLVDLVTDGYAETALSEAHKAVISLTDVFLGHPGAGPDDGTRQLLLDHYGPAGTVELTAGLALFVGFSKIAVALGAFPDDFATMVIPTPGDRSAS
jgi:alkylhydroperoxidase family enzyme